MWSKAELQSKFKNYISKPASKAELQQCKLRHCISKSMRALHKATDLYVKGMEECASKVNVGYGGGAIGCCPAAAPQVSRLPKSFTFNYSKSNSEEKFLNFVEAMSKKRSMEESNLLQEDYYAMKNDYGNGGGGLKRSFSASVGVGLARIDEEMPCYFEEDALLTRSRSYGYKRYYNY